MATPRSRTESSERRYVSLYFRFLSTAPLQACAVRAFGGCDAREIEFVLRCRRVPCERWRVRVQAAAFSAAIGRDGSNHVYYSNRSASYVKYALPSWVS